MSCRAASSCGSMITCSSSARPPTRSALDTPSTRSSRPSISSSAIRRMVSTSMSAGLKASSSGCAATSLRSRKRARSGVRAVVTRSRSAARAGWAALAARIFSASGGACPRTSQATGRSFALAVRITGLSASIGQSRTCCTRVLTFTSACDMSVPTANSSSIVPSESLESLDSFTSPSTLRSCSSRGCTSSRSISCGLAPTQRAPTEMVGVCTSGVSCTGIESRASTPNSVTRITPTATFTGLATQAATRFIVGSRKRWPRNGEGETLERLFPLAAMAAGRSRPCLAAVARCRE